MDYFEKYKKISFYEQVKKNKIQSFFLILIIILIVIALGYIIGYVYNPDAIWFFIIIATVISVIYSLIGLYAGSGIALASVGAKEADPLKYKDLHSIVEGLCLGGGLPKPKVYLMPVEEINAFASGRNPENAVVCVSQGALQYLTKRELEGVLAHEMSHIANYDIRFMTLATVLVGLISIIAQLFLRSLWFSSGDGDNKNGIFIIIGIVFAILAPLFATLVQLAISRKREYMADASAVKLARDNSGLVGALKKIGNYYEQRQSKLGSSAVSSLFIAEPTLAEKLFSSHPPLKDRIKALEAM
jgi:heat shock protein HtpX